MYGNFEYKLPMKQFIVKTQLTPHIQLEHTFPGLDSYSINKKKWKISLN